MNSIDRKIARPVENDSSLTVGVFDSGLGGLTGLRRLQTLAPWNDYIYFGDTARVPYGGRDRTELIRFAHQNIRFLQSKGVDRILIACGTISSVLPAEEWETLPLPCQGVVLAATDAALQVSKNKKIGIWATEATIRSGSYVSALTAKDQTVQPVALPCPSLVPLIEGGKATGNEMVAAVQEYLIPVLAAGCDTLILGCTHYTLIAPLIKKLSDGQLQLIDSAGEAAAALLADCPAPTLDLRSREGKIRCFVSGNAKAFSANAAALLGAPLSGVTAVDAAAFAEAVTGTQQFI